MAMKSKIRYLFFAVLIFLIACPVCIFAAEKEHNEGDRFSDTHIVTTGSIQVNCYETSKYFVVAKEVQGKLGTDCLIKYKSKPDEKLPCTYISGNNDFEIKNEWAEYFAGLKGDFLVLDSTTGPGPSGLTIWNLIERKKVYEGSWSDPEESKDDSLVFWMETGEASDVNCPELKEWESHGLGGAIETKVILNLADFKITKTPERRCRPRQ
jgi:hypothetical protein